MPQVRQPHSERKSSRNGYAYYGCERNKVVSGEPCDFMTWDVPVKENCPECGMTMFKKSGRGFKKPFCINPKCSRFLPEDQRGYPKKKAAEGDAAADTKAKETKDEKKPAARKAASTKDRCKENQPPKRLPRPRKRRQKNRRPKEVHRRKTAAKKKADATERGLSMDKVKVIGAGLAGCEAAWQLAQREHSASSLMR